MFEHALDDEARRGSHTPADLAQGAPNELGDEGTTVLLVGRALRAVEEHHDGEPVLDPEGEHRLRQVVVFAASERPHTPVEQRGEGFGDLPRYGRVEERLFAAEIAIQAGRAEPRRPIAPMVASAKPRSANTASAEVRILATDIPSLRT